MLCVHMRAAGNDFMVIDGRNQKLEYPALARKACSITGADGFMALEESETADFRLHFYNCDGSRASMCGNGSRCICRFAYDLGLVGEKMTVQTDAGVITGRRVCEDVYEVLLPAPEQLCLGTEPGVDYCVCGVPHTVCEAEKRNKEVLYRRAIELRNGKDCNVNFYTRIDGETVKVLTYERGVEDFTQACGTGCGAVAAVLYASGRLPGKKITAINPGGELKMTVETENGRICGIYQEGSAETVKIYAIDNNL